MMWGAVPRQPSTVYPDGKAAKANVMPITELKPPPDYEKVIDSCGGHGEKVEGPDKLMPGAGARLQSGARRNTALLNIMTQGRR